MSESQVWPWVALGLLGGYHGLNPGMGWLFAVVLGLQERRRSAVLRALPAIAIGHEASIAVAALLVALAQVSDTIAFLRPLGAVALILFRTRKARSSAGAPRAGSGCASVRATWQCGRS